MMSCRHSAEILLVSLLIGLLHCGCGSREDSTDAVDLDLSAVAKAASFTEYKESMRSLNGKAVAVVGRAVTMGEPGNASFLLVPGDTMDERGFYRGEVPPYHQRIVVFMKEPWPQLPMRKRVRTTGTFSVGEETRKSLVWSWASLRDSVAETLKD